MEYTILLDMDGVCCNLEYALCCEIEKEHKYLAYARSGKNLETFFDDIKWDSVINKLGFDFWSNIPEYIYFNKLMSMLTEYGDVYFCTRPTINPMCIAGKVDWLQKRFGKTFRKYIISYDKYIFAQEKVILIDDNRNNIRNFVKHGGNVIPFPRHHDYIVDKVSYVESQLQKIIAN